MGELQLEVTLENCARGSNVEVTAGRPQVAYRETLNLRAADARYLHRQQSGGAGPVSPVVLLRFEPLARGEGLRFASRITGGAAPREFVPSVEAGIRRAAAQGVLAGLPGGRFQGHPCWTAATTSAIPRRWPSRPRRRLALPRSRRAMLPADGAGEPVMAVEVVTPADHVGDVIGDMHRRRGLVRGQPQRGGDGSGSTAVVEAHVPLAGMFGYIGSLRALTSGRASFAMRSSITMRWRQRRRWRRSPSDGSR
ncbi:hypothetical protein ACU4GD_13085 [Cupriavidus basilensis]